MLAERNNRRMKDHGVSCGEKAKIKKWLGDRDSNPDKQSQSLLSYR